MPIVGVIPHEMLQSELAVMLKMNRGDVKRLLGTVQPVGKRNGFDLYSVKEACRVLVRPPDDVVERILHMHADDLPPHLSKEYWLGQDKRMTVLERRGDLWDTRKVIELAGDTFKTLRLELMLLSDAVEREVGLTEKQRELLLNLVNNALESARGKLVDGFKQRQQRPGGEPQPLEDDDPAAGL